MPKELFYIFNQTPIKYVIFIFQDNRCIKSTVVEYEYKSFLFIVKNLRCQK